MANSTGIIEKVLKANGYNYNKNYVLPIKIVKHYDMSPDMDDLVLFEGSHQ